MIVELLASLLFHPPKAMLTAFWGYPCIRLIPLPGQGTCPSERLVCKRFRRPAGGSGPTAAEALGQAQLLG